MKKKHFWEMTTHELAAATKQFDQPNIAGRSRPLTQDERKQWNQAKRKRGRPQEGKGYQRISVSMERDLLKRATALARKRQISRSRLFAQALEAVLANDGAS
jgi:hypothetical protein